MWMKGLVDAVFLSSRPKAFKYLNGVMSVQNKQKKNIMATKVRPGLKTRFKLYNWLDLKIWKSQRWIVSQLEAELHLE